MSKTSFKKILRDLFKEKGKLFTVLLALSIGIFCFALLSTSQNLLSKNLDENYISTNPKDFIISVNNINKTYLEKIKTYDYIEDIENRTKIPARIMVNDSYLSIELYVVEDFKNIQINKFDLDRGTYPELPNDILIERDGIKVLSMDVGEELRVRIPDYDERQVNISGFVHDPSFAPSSNEGMLYGFINKSFLEYYNYEQKYTDIYVTLKGELKTIEEVEEKSFKLKDELIKNGVIVRNVTNLVPNTHPHQTQMNALLFLLMMLGILAIILSGFIIITMISSIMEKQLRQIGILKAVGASTKQIIGIYIMTVFIMSILLTRPEVHCKLRKKC